ncbi:MAG TPA: hypothetical protein VF074_14840 [Pyrinomonadaceae bacterium]
MNFRFRLSLFLFPVLLLTMLVAQPDLKLVDAESSTETSENETESCPIPSANFITWFPDEKTCAVCETKNIFLVPGSWGNYIYQYPSKYQLIFWPYTDSASWYSCKKCRMTAFMGDFENVPKDKVAELRKVLESVTLPAQKTLSEKESFEHPPYLDLPLSDRMLVAEKVYQTLGVKGDGFWAQFYRVLGSHLEGDKKLPGAAEARRKALKIVEPWLTDKAKEGQRKESLYICGAMRHFLDEDAEAMKLFVEAEKLKYSDASLNAEQNQGYDEYLSTLIKEYIEMLKKGEGPKKMKAVH